MMNFSDSEIKDTFDRMSSTINQIKARHILESGRVDLFEIAKDWNDATDREIFEILASCSFAGGMSIKVLESKWGTMREAFGNFEIAYVTQISLDDLLENDKIVRHPGKLAAVIANARKIQKIQGQEGSLKRYFEARVENGYDYVLKCVIDDFKFLGPATGRDFLKEIGLGGFKPDVHVERICDRLGLSDGSIEGLKSVFDRISRVTGFTVRQIDRMLFTYGSGHNLEYNVCGTHPRCDVCRIQKCGHAERL